MQIVYSPAHEKHQPKTFIRRGAVVANPEMAARAATLLEAARAAGHRIVAPDDFGAFPREAVHSKDYLDFLATIHARWQSLAGAAEEVVPNIHPGRHMARRPVGLAGLVGYHTADTAQRQAVFIRDDLLPEAREVYRVAALSYGLGATSAIDLLDAKRTLVDAQRQYVDALGSANDAQAALELALGAPIPGGHP